MWEGGGHWELLVVSASLEVMETVTWLYLTTEVSRGFPLAWPFSLWCVTSSSWGVPPPFALSLPWEGAPYLGIGAGVGEEPEWALLVAEWAHDGVVGLTDLLAGEKDVEGAKGDSSGSKPRVEQRLV